METTCTTSASAARVYSVRLSNGGWARAFVEEWPRGGSFACISDFGTYAYIWNAVGDRTLREFLCQLDYDYFMGKAHPSHGDKFDSAATLRFVKQDLLDARKSRTLDRNEARALMGLMGVLEGVDGLDHAGENDFYAKIMDSEIGSVLYQNDPTAIPHKTCRDPECDMFWRQIWPVLCETWKKEGQQHA